MRLKAMPVQRKRNYSYAPANASQENINSTGIAQDVNKEFMDIEEYGRMLESRKNPEAKRRKVLEATGDSIPMQLVSGKYVREISCVFDAKSPAKDTSEAMNLSTKNYYKTVVKNETISGSSAPDCPRRSDKFAGSLLYQIMTDPKFVENIKNNKEMKKLTCKFCKEQFVNDLELQHHLDSRLNEFNHITCCACGKTFGQKRYLRYHQRCHVGKNQFTCGICKKKYSRMDNLTRHRAYHTDPDKYPCNICKKTFARRDLMTKHLKSHEGQKVNYNL